MGTNYVDINRWVGKYLVEKCGLFVNFYKVGNVNVGGYIGGQEKTKNCQCSL